MPNKSPNKVDIEIKKAPAVETKTTADPSWIIADGGVYVAKEKCYYGIRLYAEGVEHQSTKGEKLPHHFKKKKRYVEVED
ncbi:MAG: hypothetical protein DRP09_12610 [Candidatus Thorarchaeota archaeon]|nr:MAG: hypothetical protein DRP09_12610 [Candidatus Thorarchaeota archaeon]